MYLGFVSRKNEKVNKEHVIYGFHQVDPKLLLSNVNFNYLIGWGMVKQLFESLHSQADGNYILMKTTSGPKQLVKLLRVKETTEDNNNQD